MRIYFERSGGFMGRRIAGIVDTNALPGEEGDNLCKMIDDASFFDLPEAFTPSAEGYDQYQYKLFVEDEERQHIVETTDSAAPDVLKPLLRQLTLLTRSRPKL